MLQRKRSHNKKTPCRARYDLFSGTCCTNITVERHPKCYDLSGSSPVAFVVCTASDGLACAQSGRLGRKRSVGPAVQLAAGPSLCKATVKADHDLHAGRRRRHDRPGAYGHPANESVRLAITHVVTK